MSLRHEILGILHYSPSTGYEITKMINSEGLFFWQAQQSQVYREIAKLQTENLIEAGDDSTEHKSVFVTTKKGDEELIRWLNTQDVAASVEIRNPLVMKMFFSNIADRDKSLQMFLNYKEECKRMLESISNQQQTVLSLAKDKQDSVFFSLSSFYGVGFYNFSIEWADKCIAVLQKLKKM